MSESVLPLKVLLLSLLLTACTATVPLGEKAELQEGDTVAIAGVGMRIRLEDVGHGWYADGGHFPIVYVTISHGGSTNAYEIEDKLELGGYTIQISEVFEPEGTCSIVVTQR
jgi:hypothetical protein